MIALPGETAVADTAGIYGLLTNGDDFVTELTEDKDLVHRRIVRIAKTVRATEDGAGELVLEAQAIIAGRVIACASTAARSEEPRASMRPIGVAHEDLVWLRGGLEHLGLDARGGNWRMGWPQGPTRNPAA